MKYDIPTMAADGTPDEEIIGAIMDEKAVTEGDARIILAGLRDPSIYSTTDTSPE